ncbi:MAG: hypothetical protein IJ776_00795 [Paludibacteraceae bacterium]|nr:hypothetical protein [Paludibacteraceae bacterium]
MKRGAIVILLFSVSLASMALEYPCDSAAMQPLRPRLQYSVDALFYFDNREYKAPWQNDQTLFAIRLSPEIGVGFTDKRGGVHRVMAGVSYIQPMGGNWKDIHVHPTVFYQYSQSGFRMSLGAVPYKYFFRQLPDFLRYDSIAYAHPNIQGALFQYGSKHGFVEAMLDWRGLQRPDQREMFRITIDGEYGYRGFFRYFVGGVAQLNHKANHGDPTPHEGVCDDAYISPNIGIDFAQPTPLDTLSLRASYIYGFQRERASGTLHQPQGFLLEFMINWKWVGAKNTFYYGNNLMPFYGTYGADLNQGDPFYQSRLYNRTDLYVYFVRMAFVSCYFSWNMHYVPEGGLQHQQQVVAVFSLDGLHRKGYLRGPFEK